MSDIPRIITADCSFPREIDDGLFVERLDENHELYRVGVCVVDTSRVYDDQDVVKQAHDRTAAKYWDLPDGERGYDPMIDPDLIKDLEFTAGSVRDALIVTFLVGAKQGPSEVDASFGKVEVVENKNYKDFANFVTYGKGERFFRASTLIKEHLGYMAYGDHVGRRPQWRNGEAVANASSRAWKRGSKINEAFMVATNHLVGKMLASEGQPAIYRIHNPRETDERYLEFLAANVARYSMTPGLHAGLGLDPYCRVTSPLRRLDDLVMNYRLKRRSLGHEPTDQDFSDIAFAVQRLTEELVAAAPPDVARFNRRGNLGTAAVGQHVLPVAVGQ